MAMRVAHRLAVGALVLLSLVLIFLNLSQIKGILHFQSSPLHFQSGGGLAKNGSTADAEWPSAEDKVIVIAQLRNQSTEWVLEELPE
jgi:hypothetical protein